MTDSTNPDPGNRYHDASRPDDASPPVTYDSTASPPMESVFCAEHGWTFGKSSCPGCEDEVGSLREILFDVVARLTRVEEKLDLLVDESSPNHGRK